MPPKKRLNPKRSTFRNQNFIENGHRFLQLNTTMTNCSINQLTKTISWDIDNIYFDSHGEIAVHSLILFSEESNSDHFITLQSNMVEEDPWNPDGILCCTVCKSGSSYTNFTATSHQFYKIDCARPRHLAFQFGGSHPKEIKFAQIVLAIK